MTSFRGATIQPSQKALPAEGDTDGGDANNVVGAYGIEIPAKLNEIIKNLGDQNRFQDELIELRTIIVESDIKLVEINHSELIGALLGCFTDDEGSSGVLELRLRIFIHVFANCPMDNLHGEDLDSYVVRDPGVGDNALSALVTKLNSLFSQIEHFSRQEQSPFVPEALVNALAATTSAGSSNKSKAAGLEDKTDPLWNDGIVVDTVPPYLTYLSGFLKVSDPGTPVLNLLRVIYCVSRFWRHLYLPVIPGSTLLPQNMFINTQLATQTEVHIADSMATKTSVPQWLEQIGIACPFLFSFEIRKNLFNSISWNKSNVLLTHSHETRVSRRVRRRKLVVSRDNILNDAERIFRNHYLLPNLEIRYKNEIGSGVGPTVKFYSLVCQELQKKELGLWNCESPVDNLLGDDTTGNENYNTFVKTNLGLFPSPIGNCTTKAQIRMIIEKFKFMGRFMAKAVMDSRMIDLPLSKTLYSWILGEENSISLSDMGDVDSSVAQSFNKLHGVVLQKKKLEAESGLSGDKLNAALESLTLDGCRIDNLGIDFTLPGNPSIELQKGGKEISCTIHNLENYIKLVCYWKLVRGVSQQMEAWREGFDSVFPSSSLRLFLPDEMKLVFGGSSESLGENWDLQTLRESCKMGMGYTYDSRAVQFLFEIMASYNMQGRRNFLEFITGSPHLPVGGLRGLQPPLTIVKELFVKKRKEDDFLPFVMMCTRYLLLPDYSTLEIMRNKMRLAVDDGRMPLNPP